MEVADGDIAEFSAIERLSEGRLCVGLIRREGKAANRKSPQNIVDVLFELFGDKTHVSTLTGQFFSCRQDLNIRLGLSRYVCESCFPG